MTVPTRVIDTHTHVFNARYLPLEGVTRPYVGGFLARRLDRLVNKHTGASRLPKPAKPSELFAALDLEDADDEPTFLELAVIQRVETELDAAALRVDENFASVEVEYGPIVSLASKEAHHMLAQDEALQILEEVDAFRAQEEPNYEASRAHDLITSDIRLKAEIRLSVAGSGLGGRLRKWVGRVVRWLVQRVINALPDHLQDYVRFVCNLLRSEKGVIQRLQWQYAGVPQPPMAYFHFMMDMQYAYEPPDEPYYDVMEQLRRMHGIQVLSEGSLLGFAAFDPRRPNWADVRDEVVRLGFIGVKFYPPMGYRPAGNDDSKIESRMDAFFDWAEDNEIPVVTHCSPTGFQAYPHSGENGHPKYWRARLEKNPQLRLILLHAGGARQTTKNYDSPGWFAANDEEWSAQDNFARLVCELCREFDFVYSEISHFHEALKDSAEAENLARNVRREIVSTDGKHALADKLMYGSDWHMPRIEDEADEYLELYFDILGDTAMDTYRERFFWKNAVRFLDLPSWRARAMSWPGTGSSAPLPKSTKTYVDDVMSLFADLLAELDE